MFKKLLIATSFATALFANSTKAAVSRATRGTEKTVNISSSIFPSGFGSGDVVTVINGLFPNSCYQWVRAEVTHDDAFHHAVKGIAYLNQGACLITIIPFSEEVHLGAFEKGRHTVRYVNGDGTFFEKQVDIE